MALESAIEDYIQNIDIEPWYWLTKVGSEGDRFSAVVKVIPVEGNPFPTPGKQLIYEGNNWKIEKIPVTIGERIFISKHPNGQKIARFIAEAHAFHICKETNKNNQ